MKRIRQQMMAWTAWSLLFAAALSLNALPAAALTGSANITVQNGVVSITGQIPLANGGTAKNITPALGAALYLDADSVEVLAPGSSGQCYKSGGAGAPTWGACATADTNTIPQIAFGSGMVLTGGVASYYVWPGPLDTNEETVAGPVEAGTYTNLRCRGSAAQGVSNDVAVTIRSGSCGTTALSTSDSTVVCTLTGHGTNKATCSSTNTVSPTAGQCVSAKITTPATLTNPVAVSCTMERTA